MASFSARYPRAVHILPLHALKSIWRSGALLSKASLESDQTAAVRPTTSGVDEALGFQHKVYFYLLGYAQPWEVAPILAAQLGPRAVSVKGWKGVQRVICRRGDRGYAAVGSTSTS